MSSRTEAASPGRGPTDRPDAARWGWRRLQVVAALAAVAALVVPMAIQLTFEPFIVAMAAPLLVGVLLMLRWPRVAAVVLGVLSLALLAFSAPFIAEALTHPEAAWDFVSLVVFTLGTLLATVAAIPAFREGTRRDDAGPLPRTIAAVAAGAIVVALVVAVVASTGVEDVPARAGDLRMVTEESRFEPAATSVPGGTISVHVTNDDPTRHTFTIDELGVDLNLPPGSSQRVTFTAEPGTYRFYCRPHAPGMEGALAVG